MFDPITLAMIGGAAGGLLNKKDPLKGALIGAGLGAAGGAFAPGLMGTTPGATAGLLAPGAASGAGSQAAMLAAQNQGFGAVGSQMLAQAAGTAAPASVNAMAGMQRAGEALSGGMRQAKPFMDAGQAAMQVNSMFQRPQQPQVIAQAPPLQQPMPTGDLSELVKMGKERVASIGGDTQQRRMARRNIWSV